jgi:hypothetical protein
MDLVCDGNLNALIKEGNPPHNELIAVETEMRIQYADAMGDHEYRHYVNAMKEVTVLQLTLTQIESLIEVLRDAYHPVFAKELNDLLRCNLQFDVSDPKQYDHNLDRAFRRSRSYKMRIDLKSIEIRKLELKYMGGNGKPAREYFYGLLISLSDDAGYPLNETVTVWEFCERIRRANRKAEQHKQAKKR